MPTLFLSLWMEFYSISIERIWRSAQAHSRPLTYRRTMNVFSFQRVGKYWNGYLNSFILHGTLIWRSSASISWHRWQRLQRSTRYILQWMSANSVWSERTFFVCDIVDSEINRELIPAHGPEVFLYAAKHDYPNLVIKSLPFVLGRPLSEIIAEIPSHLVLPWVCLT